MTMKWKRSIRGRLTGIIMLTSTAAVLLACLGFTASGLINLHRRQIADMSTISELIGSNSTAALTFGDRQAAREILSALRAKPSIVGAAIFTKSGAPFATYEPNASLSVPRVVEADGFHIRNGNYEFFSPITLNHQQRIGTFCIVSDSRDRNSGLKQYAAIAGIIVVLSLLAALFLSSRLQGSLSDPIVELARVADLVSNQRTFSVRASHSCLKDGDEICDLMMGFNSMLAALEQRDHKLVEYQTQLETTVAQRTAELTTANEELLIAKDAAEKAAITSAQLARESALILNNATDGILGVGLDNRPVFANPAAVRMLGMRMEDLEGRSIHEAIHHSHADGTAFPEDECAKTITMRAGGTIGMVDDTFWRSDGSSFPVEYSSTPMLDEAEDHIGAVVVFRDVTERRAIEKLKSEFVSTVSHELRTPLTSIRGALGLLSSGLLGAVAEKGQRMLEIAVSNTDRLVRLINDILDLERIESGRVEVRQGFVDAQAVMDQAREGLQSIADSAGVRMVAEPMTGSLWGDSDRIIQTLTNLIGNAIKFSPPDTTVTLSGTAGATDFTFCVADHGRGVPEDKLALIFQRFSQVDASDSRDKGGSGLGLAISQSIVIAHGGRIWAEKNEPAGTRVQFTIPLAVRAPVSRPMDTTAAREAIPSDSEAPSVLIVEDDSDLARVMATALQRHGLHTVHTASGNEAVRLCNEHPPSLIVLDLGLQDLDGYGVVRSLRRSPTLRRVPLLVYSGLDLRSSEQSRLRLGTTEFLTKSRCSLADFEAQVVRLLETASPTEDSQHAA